MRKCAFLDLHVNEVSGTLTSTRTLMGGINNAKEQFLAIKKKMLLLENRLEKSYIKYNKSITHNKELREQINNLRQVGSYSLCCVYPCDPCGGWWVSMVLLHVGALACVGRIASTRFCTLSTVHRTLTKSPPCTAGASA